VIAALSLSACGETRGLVSRDPGPTEVVVRFVAPDARTSQYVVYRPGSRPRVRFALEPALPERELGVRVQRKDGGLWLSAWSRTTQTGEEGTAVVTIPAFQPGSYRVHARFIGDAVYFGSESQWRYYVVRPAA
jgi:hypothetical protein